jgi:hypothetical protein
LRCGRFGVRRRSTLTCCRRTRFSASSVALALKREDRIPRISLNRPVIECELTPSACCVHAESNFRYTQGSKDALWLLSLPCFCRMAWPTIRARKSNSSSTGAYFFGALDLTETPSRIAALRIRSGVRFIAFAICSSVLEARASAITRRSSLNDQPFRISRHSRPLRTKPPSGVYSPDGFATVGPD